MTQPAQGWMAVSGSSDLPAGRARAVMIDGEDIVIWRSISGDVRAWENRCIHRGMRLSFGQVRGENLTCRYHGWQFNLNGQCTHMPATPSVEPAATLCMPAFHCTEANGLIWVSNAAAESTDFKPLSGAWLFGRSLYLNENADAMKLKLARAQYPSFSGASAGETRLFRCESGPYDTLQVVASSGQNERERVLLAVQSVGVSRCAVHCCLAQRNEEQPARDLLMRFQGWIKRVRWFLHNPNAEYDGYNPLPMTMSSAGAGT